MIYQVPSFSLRVPQLLGHDTVMDFEPLTQRVIRTRNDVDDVTKSLKLALPGARTLIVVILAPTHRVDNGLT